MGENNEAAGGRREMLEWQGLLLHPFSQPAHLQAVQDMDFRPDDIIIATYPKSGTHWLYEMVMMLLRGKAEPTRDPVRKSWLEHPECDPSELQTRPSPRLVVTHLPIDRLPGGVAKAGCRVLVMERKVKDMACSLYAMVSDFKSGSYFGSWDSFANTFLQGNTVYNSYFDHLKGYRQAAVKLPCNPVCILSYEQMKKDHVGQLGRVNDFLELDRSPQLLTDIATLTDFQSMQKYKSSNGEDVLFKSGKNGFFRKGEVGDWKNWFTVAQSEKFDAEYLKQMGEPFQED